MIESEKQNEKVPGKDKWETIDVITLMPLAEVNNSQPILNTYKRMVHCYYKNETVNKFEIGYMINP